MRLSGLWELCLRAENIQLSTSYKEESPLKFPSAPSGSSTAPQTPPPPYQPHPQQNSRSGPRDNASARASAHKEWPPWSAPPTIKPLIPDPSRPTGRPIKVWCSQEPFSLPQTLTGLLPPSFSPLWWVPNYLGKETGI